VSAFVPVSSGVRAPAGGASSGARGARSRLLRWASAALLPACSGDPPSTLQPAGPAAERVASTWWLMLGAASAVVVVVGVLVLVGALGRRRASTDATTEPRWSRGLILVGGVVVPLVVVGALWGVTLRDMAELSAPAGSTALEIEVIGHRWWWQVRYPERGVETANDIHIPAGEPVRLVLESIDVIHSFWVPELGVKTDMIPGRANAMWLQADRPGVYRGQCAEFCGIQHANMIFFVVAHPPAEFDAWLDNEAGDAAEPEDGVEAAGREVFLSAPCVACHTIRGVSEEGALGPDLTHFGSRRSIGAGAVPNTMANLLAWIPNAQAIKPGNRMPPIPLDTDELEALAAYLESLE
jgi:cytochrome c oxidase subunit II